MKWIILAFGIFAAATAGPVEYSDEDSGEDSLESAVLPERTSYMTVKEAEETVEYILNTTKKIRYYESRLNESVDILKNKIWPGLRGEIVTIFSEQKQKVLNLFASSKTDVVNCENIFQEKVDGLVAVAEEKLLNVIKPLHEKIIGQEIYVNSHVKELEGYLTEEEKIRDQIEACTNEHSNYWNCQLKDGLKETLDDGAKGSLERWYEYVNELRTAVMTNMDSILDKYDSKLIKKQVYAAVTECLLTFEVI